MLQNESDFNLLKKISVSDISFLSLDEKIAFEKYLDGIRDRMKKYMATAVKKQSTDLLFFIMTSIPDEDSEILAAGAGAQEALEKAFGIPAGTDKILVKGLVSRKKQFIPAVTGVL